MHSWTRRRMALHVLFGSTALMCLGLSNIAAAADRQWTGAVSGDWTAGGNWTGGVPSSPDTAIIGTSTPHAPLLSGASTNILVQYLRVGGNSGAGLTLNGGAKLSNYSASIAYNASETGSVTVEDTGTLWHLDGGLYVGHRDTGSLTIGNGGRVESGSGYVSQGGAGTVTVTGSDSTWAITTFLVVGDEAHGTLSIQNGGSVTAANGTIGVDGTGEVNISGAGSSLGVTNTLTIGNNNAGVVTVSHGGALSATTIRLGWDTGVAGTLNIGAAEGDTAVAGGTITGAVTFGNGNGKLVFNHDDLSSGLTFASNISGNGTIAHVNGFTNFTGSSSSFTGTTNVTGGAINVTGSLGGTTTLDNATLIGSGTLGVVQANNGSRIMPGGVGTIATLSSTGNVTLGSGSLLALELGNGTSDKLVVGGALAIQSGATLRLLPSVAFVAGDFRIITATGGITGQFDTVNTASLSGVTANLNYQPHWVDVSLSSSSSSGQLVPAATSPSGTAAANVLDAARGNSQMNNLITVLDGLPAGQKAAALTSLSGQTTTTIAAMPTAATSSVVSTVLNHNTAKPGANAPARFSSQQSASAGEHRGRAAGGVAPMPEQGAWASVLGGFGSTDRKGGTAGSDSRTGGLAGGIDLPLQEDRLTMGASFGYVNSQTDIDGNGGEATAQAGFLGLYGRLEEWGLRLDGTLMGGRHFNEQQRNIVIGTATSTASGENDGWSLGVGLQVSTPFELVRNSSYSAVLRPYLGVNAQRYWQKAWTETGAGTANLSYGSLTRDSVVGRIGTGWEFDIPVSTEVRVLPLISVGLARQFAANAPTMDAAFALLPGQRFSVQGAEMDRNSLEVALGVDVVDFGSGNTLTLGYGGTLARDAQDHTFSARVKLPL